MKQARYGSLPMKIPPPLRGVGNLPRWAGDVVECIKLLRDRPVIVPGNPTGISPSTHPWKVTSNGDDTVKVAAGQAFHYYSGEADEGAALVDIVDHTETESTTVSDTGTSYIYAEMPVGSVQVVGATSYKQLAGTVTIVADNTAPASMDVSSNVYLLLATVEKTGDVVEVTQQHIEHNPTLQLSTVDAPASGDTFIYNIWESDIYISTPYDPLTGIAPTITVDNGSTPTATFYVLDGVWHETQPTGWPDPFTGYEYHCTYNTPDIGGPAP